jgi:hypothetical protein
MCNCLDCKRLDWLHAQRLVVERLQEQGSVENKWRGRLK